MTPGSSRFLLKFLAVCIDEWRGNGWNEYFRHVERWEREEGGLSIHRQVDRGGSRSRDTSPADSRFMLQEKKGAGNVCVSCSRGTASGGSTGKGTGGKVLQGKEEGEERKEKLLERGKFLWLPFATLDFHNPLKHSGGFTKVFLIQQMTKMVILWEGVKRETV